MWKIDSCKQRFCTLSTEEIGRVKVQAGKGCLPVAALLVALLLCKMSMFKCMYLSFSRTLCWSTMLKKKKKVFSLVFLIYWRVTISLQTVSTSSPALHPQQSEAAWSRFPSSSFPLSAEQWLQFWLQTELQSRRAPSGCSVVSVDPVGLAAATSGYWVSADSRLILNTIFRWFLIYFALLFFPHWHLKFLISRISVLFPVWVFCVAYTLFLWSPLLRTF